MTTTKTAQTVAFEHEGTSIVFHTGSVRTAMEARRIVNSLLRAYGHIEGNPAPDDVYNNFAQYGEAMARSETDAAWWAHSIMSDEEIKARFESFLSAPQSLYTAYFEASTVLDAPRKTSKNHP